MERNIAEILGSDHDEVDRLLDEVFAALDSADPDASLKKLDLFWARLAVHIRAEHHHLFPAVSRLAEDGRATGAPAVGVADMNELLDELHHDHDLFMRELIAAIKKLRSVQAGQTEVLEDVRSHLVTVAERLVEHNRIEEETVYPLADALSAKPNAAELARSIEAELANLPPRFRSITK